MFTRTDDAERLMIWRVRCGKSMPHVVGDRLELAAALMRHHGKERVGHTASPFPRTQRCADTMLRERDCQIEVDHHRPP